MLRPPTPRKAIFLGPVVAPMILVAIMVFAMMPVAMIADASTATHLNVPFHAQETNGCGPATVEMLERYWSARVPSIAQPDESKLRAALPVTKDQGTLLSDMRDYLETRGYQAFTLRASATDLSEQIAKGRVPIIALKNKSGADLHYVLVTGLDQ